MPVIFHSCHTSELYEKQDVNRASVYEDIMMSPETPLYSFLPEKAKKPLTKSGGEAAIVSLESLLDRSRTETLEINGKRMVQIPFAKGTNNTTVSFTDSPIEKISKSNASTVKKYLMEIIDLKTGEVNNYIVAMVPTSEFYRKFGDNSFSFLDKSIFEGIVIFSNIDGSFRRLNVYGNGPIDLGSVVDPADSSYGSLMYISFSSASPYSTKADDEWCLTIDEPSICIGSRDNSHDYTWGDTDNIGKGRGFVSDESPNKNVSRQGGGGGGGGGSGHGHGKGENNNYNESEIKDTIIACVKIDSSSKKDDPNTFKISLYKSGDGYVYPSGYYSRNRLVFCQANPGLGWYFDRWTGDFLGRGPNFCVRIQQDISSTAYFFPIRDNSGPVRPCYDKERNITNPLKSMKIAAPKSGRLLGGTYGHVRYNVKGQKTFHSGLDLYAQPGTEIYAMIDGIIYENISYYITEQPNKKTKNYPEGYKGDTDGAGNRIYIKGKHNGEDVLIGLWHLQAGKPVATNPRTGKPFAPGDMVFRGEIVAYSGITGNAYNVPEPHLHLVYKVKNAKGNYVYRNPERIINGKVDWLDGKILSSSIMNIICDSESVDYDNNLWL